MYYTYLWLRENGTPYYVGKGSGKRGYVKHSHRMLPPLSKDRIIVQDFETEAEAFEAEVFLIQYYGREDKSTGCLLNLTDGGEGFSGISNITRERMSAAAKVKVFTKEHRENMGKAHVGNTARLGLPSWNKGLKGVQKAWNKGKEHSKLTRKRISEAKKDKPSNKLGKSGYRGILWSTKQGKWQVVVYVKGKKTYFGQRKELGEALSLLEKVLEGLRDAEKKDC
jgi:hypothetical protein